MQTTAMRARRSAYSTRLAPPSPWNRLGFRPCEPGELMKVPFRLSAGTESGRAEARPANRSAASDYWIAEATDENLLEAFLPSRVTAAMHTTAMRATRSAYSTSEAPRSVLQRDCSQAFTNSYEVSISGWSPLSGADGWLPESNRLPVSEKYRRRRGRTLIGHQTYFGDSCGPHRGPDGPREPLNPG